MDETLPTILRPVQLQFTPPKTLPRAPPLLRVPPAPTPLAHDFAPRTPALTPLTPDNTPLPMNTAHLTINFTELAPDITPLTIDFIDLALQISHLAVNFPPRAGAPTPFTNTLLPTTPALLRLDWGESDATPARRTGKQRIKGEGCRENSDLCERGWRRCAIERLTRNQAFNHGCGGPGSPALQRSHFRLQLMRGEIIEPVASSTPTISAQSLVA